MKMSEAEERALKRFDYIKKYGGMVPGVSDDVDPEKPPKWFDPTKFEKAQKLAETYYASLNFAHLAGLLFIIQIPSGLIPLLVTGNSADVPKLFRRYLSTVVHTKYWYETDPFNPKSSAFKSLKQVRGMHSRVCKMMNAKGKREAESGRIWVSQRDMAHTQFAFIGLFVLYPEQCGMHDIGDEVLDCLNYFWRVMGHALGIEDKFNLCFGDLEESRALYRFIFEKDWRPIISSTNPPAPVGIEMGKGICLAMQKVSPTLDWDALMKYWFDVFGIPKKTPWHSLKSTLLYYYLYFSMNYTLGYEWAHRLAGKRMKKHLIAAVAKKKEKEEKVRKEHGHLRYEERGGCPFGTIDISYEDAFEVDPNLKTIKSEHTNSLKQQFYVILFSALTVAYFYFI